MNEKVSTKARKLWRAVIIEYSNWYDNYQRIYIYIYNYIKLTSPNAKKNTKWDLRTILYTGLQEHIQMYLQKQILELPRKTETNPLCKVDFNNHSSPYGENMKEQANENERIFDSGNVNFRCFHHFHERQRLIEIMKSRKTVGFCSSTCERNHISYLYIFLVSEV